MAFVLGAYIGQTLGYSCMVKHETMGSRIIDFLQFADGADELEIEVDLEEVSPLF